MNFDLRTVRIPVSIANAIDGIIKKKETARQSSKVVTDTLPQRRAPAESGIVILKPKSDHSASSDFSTGILSHESC